MKINKLLSVLLALVIVTVAVCGCSAENDRCTKPFDTMLNGLINCDTEMYKNAFSSDYATHLDTFFYSYGALTQSPTSFDAFISEKLTEINATLKVNYGEKITAKQSSCVVSDADKASLSGYLDYYDPSYNIPVDSITEVKTVNAYLTVKGTENSYYGYVTYTVYLIEDTWYLHPNMLFYTV